MRFLAQRKRVVDMYMKKNTLQFRSLLSFFLPKGKDELYLLLGLVIFYSSYAFYIVINTSVIDNIAFGTDTFFSFDAPEIYAQGYQSMIPHPLMKYFTAPIIFIGNALAILFETYKAKTVFWTIICVLLISLSSVYIYRYLKNIVELKKHISYFLTSIFSVTSTNLILSFTPESYTLSLFLLTFTLYFYSYSIKYDIKVNFLSNITIATLLGGTTITNYVLAVIPMFYTKDNLKLTIKKIALIGVSVLIIFLWLQLQYNFLFDVKTRLLYFTTPRGAYYEHAIDWFFGAAVFFPKVISYFNTVFNRNEYVIHMEFYHHWWQYLFIGVLGILLLYSIYKNRKNKHVQIVFLYFLTSVFIHLIIKYGIDEPMIFGGHWVYIVPILLGWLYKSLSNKTEKKYYTLLLIVMFIGLFINNALQMKNFITVALDIFPPV